MNSEKDIKFIKTFEINRKAAEERAASNQIIVNEIGKAIKAFGEYGREVELNTKQILQQYFNEIQTKIVELNDSADICRLLLTEKRKYGAKVIDAKIRKNGYDEKDYQAVIDKIIEPLFKHWESELEFEKKIPLAKQIIPDANIKEPKNNENMQPVEINKLKQIQRFENVVSEVIEKTPELPAGFKQIKCDASKEEILYFFMILAKEKNSFNDDFYMKEEDIIKFVKKNFFVFHFPPTEKYFSLNLLPEQKGRLVYFMFQFHLKYDRKLANTKMKYVMLLINNFEVFKNDKPETLITNMSESKKPKSSQNIISVSEYFIQ